MGWWTRPLERIPVVSEASSKREKIYENFDKSFDPSKIDRRYHINTSTPDVRRRKRHRSRRRSRSNSSTRDPAPASKPWSFTLDCEKKIELLEDELVKTKNSLRDVGFKHSYAAAEVSRLGNELASSRRTAESRLKDVRDLERRSAELLEDLRIRDNQIQDLSRDLRSSQDRTGECQRELRSAQDRASNAQGQLRSANLAHRREVTRLHEQFEEQQRNRDGLISKIAADQKAADKKCETMARDWHLIPDVHKAMDIGRKLSDQLSRYSLISLDPDHVEGPGSRRVFFCRLDNHSFRVPLILPQSWPFRKGGKTCAICANDYDDPILTSDYAWRRACRGFEGPWMKDIFSFPFAEDLDCQHDMDVCKNCIRDQIQSQLETGGSKIWNKISCPMCARYLTHTEIRHFASEEDFAKYERFYLLESLSKEPGFRWCLSGTCTSGQLYENYKYMHPRITCKACNFASCFKHQMPWHTGQTCTEYDHKLLHAEDEAKSEQWKKTNTKNCPGKTCGRPIEKGEGCFHMTCRECKHEFCWECLADWSKVRNNKMGHKPDCFFRTSEVGPMGMRGANLNDGLRNLW